MVPVWVEAVKVIPQVWIALVKAVKLASKVGLSPKHGHRITSFCGLSVVKVEPFKIVP